MSFFLDSVQNAIDKAKV